jgi:cysteamine dioxygenase
MNQILPEHVGLPETGYVPTFAHQAIHYLHIHADENFSMGIFCLPPNATIPLHDHPGMSVISRVLYGGLNIKSFDKVPDESDLMQELIADTDVCAWATQTQGDMSVIAPHTTMLFPDSGNIHEFTADGTHGCAILDILAPPYDMGEDRDCTYYQHFEPPHEWRTQLEAQDGLDQKLASSLLLLVETETEDDFMVISGHYTGPRVKVATNDDEPFDIASM